MLIGDVWLALAASHALEITTPSHPTADVGLAGPDFAPTDYDVTVARTVHPSRVHQYATTSHSVRPLVLASSATRAAQEAAAEAGVSLLARGESARVRGILIDSDGRRLDVDAAPTGGQRDVAAPERRTPGRTPWGTLELAMTLLDDPGPRTQRTLAQQAGLTQGRVSQALSTWDFAVRSDGGWVVADVKRATDWLAETYRQPETVATWLSLDPPVPATRTIGRLLDDHGVRWAVTGQVAADLLAPWARPTRTTIWADRLVDLRAAGCTPASAEESTVTIAVPADPRALDDATEHDGLRVVAPWRAWLTLVHDGDTAAADHLRERLLRA
jgi:hypothetical protein